MKAQIVFASMTGNNEDMAEILEDNLLQAGLDVTTTDISFADASSFLESDLCVVVTYTYGEGVMTDELKDFYDQLLTLNLTGKKFAVMGSGDRTYKDHFCENVNDFEVAFKKVGATEVAQPVKIENAVDDDDITLIDQAAHQMVEGLND